MSEKALRITLCQSGQILELPGGSSQTLLQTLEANQLNVESQCRQGYCGSCRVRLCKGEVCYLTPPLAFLRQGEILTCCCRPQGDIEIDL